MPKGRTLCSTCSPTSGATIPGTCRHPGQTVQRAQSSSEVRPATRRPPPPSSDTNSSPFSSFRVPQSGMRDCSENPGSCLQSMFARPWGRCSDDPLLGVRTGLGDLVVELFLRKRDVESEVLQTLDQITPQPLRIQTVEVVSSQVLVLHVVLQRRFSQPALAPNSTGTAYGQIARRAKERGRSAARGRPPSESDCASVSRSTRRLPDLGFRFVLGC